jgi:site-specific recombinase XerD
VTEPTSTGRVRRARPAPAVRDRLLERSKYRHGSVIPAAPVPVVPPAPQGDLSVASIGAIVETTMRVWPGSRVQVRERGRAVRAVLTHLAGLQGHVWQVRWDASEFADGTTACRSLPADPTASAGMGVKLLLCLRVLRPGLPAMRTLAMTGYAEAFRVAQADPDLNRLFTHLDGLNAPRGHRLTAAFDVACALTVFGIRLAELTPAGLLHNAWECRRGGLAPYKRGQHGTFTGQLAWQTLVEIGHFPPGTPPSLLAAGQRGQLSVTELVDRYPITNRPMRQLLIDYLTRRATAMDYSSLLGLARWLAGVFWSKIEQIAPGQTSLHIPGHVYDQWRAAITLREDGQPRLSVDPILLAVRSFYLDLHTWSVAEPDRWAAWVAPCPIDPGDFIGSAKRHRRARERSAERTRARQPLLPVLVENVTSRLQRSRRLLQLGRDLPAGAQVELGGRTYTRIWTDYDQQQLAAHGTPPVRLRDDSSDELVNLRVAEPAAFWGWAIVETLRLSGIRIEELLELTQLSIRRYQRPNGETIALLVIAPSKTDRERVIPISAELFAVIAAVIRRHTEASGKVPMVSRYDTHDKVHTAAMPFLFQRRRGAIDTAFSQAAVLHLLQRRCAELAPTHPEFAQARFTPHDFRRLFATELVNNGLPIHIGAALLGHLNLETTRGYVAVFEEDLVRHYQTHLDRRRRLRPTEEYRPATDGEWAEFEAHFDKRKVELGNCGRPYGTGCTHEHACIRCPMLHVHPQMLPRLDTIETDLRQRRSRAEDEGWLGEIEGIDLTLHHLVAERRQAQRLTHHSGPVPLGMPSLRTTAGQDAATGQDATAGQDQS